MMMMIVRKTCRARERNEGGDLGVIEDDETCVVHEKPVVLFFAKTRAPRRAITLCAPILK